jgi:hypothetical protein
MAYLKKMEKTKHKWAETSKQYNTRVLRKHIMEVVEKLEDWDTNEREQANKRSKIREDHQNDASDRPAMVVHEPQARSTTQHQRNETNPNESNCVIANTTEFNLNNGGGQNLDGMSRENMEKVSHQSIVDDLYCTVCTLYKLHHPDSWPIHDHNVRVPTVVDYQILAVAQAAKDNTIANYDTADIRNLNKTCIEAIGCYHSKAFPQSLRTFCLRVANSIEEKRADEVATAKNIFKPEEKNE